MTNVLLDFALSAPAPYHETYSTERFDNAMELVGLVYTSYFSNLQKPEDRISRISQWFDYVPLSRRLWPSVRDAVKPGLTPTGYSSSLTSSVLMSGLGIDTQSIQPGSDIVCASFTGYSVALNYNLIEAIRTFNPGPGSSVPVLSSVVSFLFTHASHPLVSNNTMISPLGSAVVTYIDNLNPTVDGSIKIKFFVGNYSAHPSITCVSFQGDSGFWQANCNTTWISMESNLLCECPVYGRLSDRISVSTLNPDGLCLTQPPQGGIYTCEGGRWVSLGSVTIPEITIPSTGPVTIVGNLTTETITFNGLGGTINVTGCTRIGTSITIELTIEEFEQLIKSGEATNLLITSSGCDISGLNGVPINTIVPTGKCEKITTTSETTTSTLSAVFKIDRSGCKKSNTWWIVLVSVLAGLIVLGAIFAVLATFTPLRNYIRPFARRAEQAANTYYVEK